MAKPPKDTQDKLKRLQEEFAVRAKLQKQYDDEMRNVRTPDMPSFSQWLAQRNQAPGMADGGNVPKLPAKPSLDTMKLVLIKNHLGMYSPLTKAAMNVPRTKGTAQEFMTEASKQPGFRQEEVEDLKIPMPEGKLTREQFVQHVQRSQPIQRIVADVRHSESDEEDHRDQTSHEEYTLPGGGNYREVLLKIPAWKGDPFIMEKEAKLRREEDPVFRERLQRELDDLKASKAAYGDVYPGNPYHFGGEPGIVASLRLKDRRGPNGEKILHVEEVQSDWHQEGRKKGYNKLTAEESKELRDLLKKENEEDGLLQSDMARVRELESRMGQGVPNAPHKKSWHELALKHALTEAVKGGYHGIAITPGEQQADRYDLSKHIDEINVTGRVHALTGEKSKSVALDTKSGQSLRLGVAPDGTIDNVSDESISNYVGKGLDEVIGKELAQKIMQGGTQTIAGEGLRVGGEGMKGFYDKMLPTFLNKLGKPHGAQVAMHLVPVTAPKSKNADADDQLLNELGVQVPTVAAPKLHYFPITPSLRQQIKTEGLPQYKRGGEVDAESAFMGREDPESVFFPQI